MARLIRTTPWAHDASQFFVAEALTVQAVADLPEAAPPIVSNGINNGGESGVAARRVDARARAEERRKISRLLHDEVGQSLTAVNVKLAVLKARAKDGLQKEILSAQQLLEKTMEQVQRLSQELHPSVVEDLGLIAALRAHIKNFSEKCAITVDLRADARVAETGPEVGVTLFRSIQALLCDLSRTPSSSMARQGSVSMIRLGLAVERDGVRVDARARVAGRDAARNGRGVIPDVPTFQEHVLMAGGSVHFRANSNQAVISARFPARSQKKSNPC
jgi:signal transduction histidine kinase